MHTSSVYLNASQHRISLHAGAVLYGRILTLEDTMLLVCVFLAFFLGVLLFCFLSHIIEIQVTYLTS